MVITRKWEFAVEFTSYPWSAKLIEVLERNERGFIVLIFGTVRVIADARDAEAPS